MKPRSANAESAITNQNAQPADDAIGRLTFIENIDTTIVGT